MKVVCKENTAEHLDLDDVKNVSKKTQYPVRKGNEYIVMGMMIPRNSNCLYYLVGDDDSSPHWMPYGLFYISDSALSPNWFVKIFDMKDLDINFFYVSGFNELCNSQDYDDYVMRYEGYAGDIYDKRKAEIEEWYEEKALIAWAKNRS